jgi:hypothetical protein
MSLGFAVITILRKLLAKFLRPRNANSSIESKWGLGLSDLKEMPPQNVYNFGLVSRFMPLPCVR